MPVKYNDSVKKPNTISEWTPEMIHELEKCKNDFYHFCKYVKIKNPDKGRMDFVPRWYQKDLLNKIINNRYFVGLLSRQIGKTLCASVYILWYAINHSEKVIGIVSNKEKSAKKILREIKRMYESLPSFLKPGVREYNMTSIEFENNTLIMVSATTEDPFRGESLNILFADEFAFVRRSIAYDFWSSNFPTLSASEESKVIIISTPNGLFNLFERIYTGAVKGENGFSSCTYDWRVIEKRDEKWKEDQIKILGKQKFLQEHEVVFLGSTNTVIESDVIEHLFTKVKEPETYDLEDRLRIWEKPQPSTSYVVGADTSKGTGEHYSTIQILKILSYSPFKAEQVAVFQDNYTDVYKFTEIIYRLALYYNYGYIMCENNAEGITVVNRLWWDYEYENLVNETQKSTGLGIRATVKTKPKAVLAMKKLIENGDIILNDLNTVNELTSFIDKGNNKFGGKDLPDDLISALYWACYITEFDVLEEETGIEAGYDDDAWGILSDINEIAGSGDDFSWLHNINI